MSSPPDLARPHRLLVGLRRHWALLVISGLYLCCSVAYSLANPPFEGNDELAHYLYIRHLITDRRLPIQESPAGKDYQNHHPPLYYMLGALVSFWADDSDLTAIIERGNPFWGYDPWAVGRDNKNQLLYAPFERFAGSGTIHRLRSIRLLSSLMGLGTVLATYGAATEIFPQRRDIALGSLAFVAFQPMFLYLSGTINNDNLIILWGACTTWGLMRLLRRGFSRPRSVALSAVLGLALATKLSALALLPIVALGLLLTAWVWGAWHIRYRTISIAGAVVLSLSGWWFVRNWEIYGDIMGMNAMLESISQAYTVRPSLWRGFRAAVRFQKSFWGCFGWNTIPIPYAIYSALDGIALLAAGGIVVLAYRAWRRGDRIRLAQVALAVTMAVVFVTAWAYYITASQTAGYGRYAFPALGAMAFLLFAGLAAYVPRRRTPHLATVSHAGMLALALFCLVGILIPAYARPQLMGPTEVAAIPHRLDFDYGGKIRLLGYDLQPYAAEPGGEVTVTLYWQALQAMQEDYIIYVHMFGQRGEKIGQRDTYPGLGRFPTSLWQPGDTCADAITVPISPEAQRPVLATVEAGLYARSTKRRLSASDSQGRSLGQTVICRLKIPPPEAAAPSIPHPSRDVFGDRIILAGYDVDSASSAGEVSLVLYWQAQGRPDRDYTVFVHLMDEEGTVIAQGDSQPLQGDYPTSAWAPGELIVDRYDLLFGPGTDRGRLHLRVGLYDLETMQRLPAYGPEGLRLGADQVELEME